MFGVIQLAIAQGVSFRVSQRANFGLKLGFISTLALDMSGNTHFPTFSAIAVNLQSLE